MVLVPPGKLAVTADETTHVKATAALELLGKLQEAKLSYEAILQRWPQSLGALIGLANIAYSQQQYQESVRFLKQAVRNHPEVAAVWHNLAIAQMAAEQKTAAKHSAQLALRLASADEAMLYQKSFAEILK